MHIPVAILATAFTVVPLSACGSTTSAVQRATLNAASAAANRPVDQLYADAIANLGAATSVHTVETSTDTAGTSTATADFGQAGGRVTANIAGTGLVTIDVVGGGVFVQSGPTTTEPTGADAQGILALRPSVIAACAAKHHGALTRGTTSTINGGPVIEIKDDGRAPGDKPTSVFVSLTDAPLPVRISASGTDTPGGDPTCGASSTPSVESTLRLDLEYTHTAPSVTAPAVTT